MSIAPKPIVRKNNAHLFLYPKKLGHMVSVGREGYETPIPTAPIRVTKDPINLISLSMNEELLIDGQISPTDWFDNFHLKDLYFDVDGAIIRFGTDGCYGRSENTREAFDWHPELHMHTWVLYRNMEAYSRSTRWHTAVEPARGANCPNLERLCNWGLCMDVEVSFLFDRQAGVFQWKKEKITATSNRKPFTQINLVGFNFDAEWSAD